MTIERRDDAFLAQDQTGLALKVRLLREMREEHGRLLNLAVRGGGERRAMRVINPEVGDVVMELTRASWTDDEHIQNIGLGYLVGREGEHHFIQFGPDPKDVADWANCAIIGVTPAVVAKVLGEARA